MKNYRLHFIRHGMTQSNIQGAYAGRRTDAELSPQGIRELLELRDSYEYPPVELVFSSPMTRCIQTAGILYPHAELEVVRNLAEIDFGDFDGKTMEELKDREDFRGWILNSATQAPPNGEAMGEFAQRAAAGLNAVIQCMMENQVEDAAVVTHGGVIGAILGGMALPKLSPHQLMVGNGRGYTCFANAQLWMRDRVIEVAGVMPHGATSAGTADKAMTEALRRLTEETRQ